MIIPAEESVNETS